MLIYCDIIIYKLISKWDRSNTSSLMTSQTKRKLKRSFLLNIKPATKNGWLTLTIYVHLFLILDNLMTENRALTANIL